MLVISGCQSSIFTPPPPPEVIQNLTPEQIENVISHSYGENCVTRWPNGAVIKVCDETQFVLIDEVLNEWNEALFSKVSLVKVEDKNQADVAIVFQPLDSNSGRAWVWYDGEYNIYKGIVEIDPEFASNTISGRRGLEYIKALYLHEFGHILGINNHFATGLMATPYQSKYIDSVTRQFIWLLYELPVGWCF